MTKRQRWVYNYKSPVPRLGKEGAGIEPPLIVPGVEQLICLGCGTEINILRAKSRFKDDTNRMLKTFSGFYPKQPEACACDLMEIEVSLEGQLTVRSDSPELIRWQVRSPKGLVLTLARSLGNDIPTYISPPLEEYSKTVYKNPKWEIEMLDHLDMHQFKPKEREVVLPGTDADRDFFLRCYAYTYKVCVSENQSTYLPTGHRVSYNPDLKGERSYPEHLIANLHLRSLSPLRLELEGITDPFHRANLTLQYAKTLRVP